MIDLTETVAYVCETQHEADVLYNNIDKEFRNQKSIFRFLFRQPNTFHPFILILNYSAFHNEKKLIDWEMDNSFDAIKKRLYHKAKWYKKNTKASCYIYEDIENGTLPVVFMKDLL